MGHCGNLRATRSRSILFLSTCCLMLLIPALRAAGDAVTLVDWGGDYVANNAVLRGTSSTTYQTFTQHPWMQTTVQRNFSETAIMSPGTGYTPPPGHSGVFYGGYRAIDSGTRNEGLVYRSLMAPYGISDYLAFEIAPIGYSADVSFIVEFAKSDFLALAGAPNVYLDAADASISVSTFSFAGFEGRFMIKNGLAWYVSDVTFSGTGAATLDNPSKNARWAPFTPGGFTFDAASASFQAIDLNDVTAVGYFVHGANLPRMTHSLMAIDGFSVRGSDRPAPAPHTPAPSAAWAGLALLSLLVTRRPRLRS